MTESPELVSLADVVEIAPGVTDEPPRTWHVQGQ